MRPWLSVWLAPRDTIDRVLAGNPRYSIWLLAALGGIASVMQLIDAGRTSALFDWRVSAGLALAGALYGFVGLYINALCLRWSGMMFGGKAYVFQLRTLLAWGGVPYIATLAISLTVLGLLKAGGGTSVLASGTFFPLLQTIIFALFCWSIVVTLLMIARVQHFGIWRAIASSIVGVLFISVISLATAISVRTFLFQPFNTPSGAQKPTLLIGDYFFVSKYPYGYTHYSLPFSPRLFAGRIWPTEPKRGDVVVFRLPKDDSTDYIKRLIGLPGDRIQMIDGLLHINGEAVERERIEDFIDTDDGKTTAVKRWRETLPNGVSHTTLDLVDNGFGDNTQVYTVPPGRYFMMGDNRDNSTDSRFSQVGMVPFENLIGRAAIIFYSVAPGAKSAPDTPRFDRIGTKVQ